MRGPATGRMESALLWIEHRVNIGTRRWLEREAEPDCEELVAFLLRGDFPWELSQGKWGCTPQLRA